MRRDRYEVVPAGAVWRVTCNGEELAECKTQATAIEVAVKTCRYRWTAHKQTAELVIKRQDGTIRDSRTYGRDPRRVHG